MSGRDDREGVKHLVTMLLQKGFYDESLFLGSQPGEPEEDDAAKVFFLAIDRPRRPVISRGLVGNRVDHVSP